MKHSLRPVPILLIVIFQMCALPARGQFFLNGNARQLNDTCFQLTSETNFVVGSIWNPDKIDLRQSFEAIINVNLGCKDPDGADGIVFGFQPVSTSIGVAGEGIGFQGIVPSLGIELDTWQNTNLNDPSYDHVAVVRNGDMNHGSGNTLAGPVQISGNPNVEDCNFHELRVTWDAAARLLEVFFDCSKRLSLTVDLADGIFRGDPLVFWGFTSATGGANNNHQICFTYTTFLDQLDDVVMCPGGQVLLKARGGLGYRWSPAEGLSNPNGSNTFAAPQQTTTYSVEIEDECGRVSLDEVVVEVAGDSVFFDLGPDTSLCEGDFLPIDVTTPTAVYSWSDGNTGPTRSLAAPGYYEVTVTRTDTFCTANDAVALAEILRPGVDLGPDTVLCQGQTLLLSAGFPGASYFWQDGSTADTFLVREPGLYLVSLYNRCGAANDGVLVDYDRCNEAYIPSAFSPNDDGLNDRLLIYHNGDVTEVRSFLLFSRWGELVYEARNFTPGDDTAGWDGRFRGRDMPQGVYVYLAEIDFRDGTSERRTGEVALLR